MPTTPNDQIIDPKQYQLINLLIKVISANLPMVFLLLFKTPTNQYEVAGIVPDGYCIDKDFLEKYRELAKCFNDSMATLPRDDFPKRLNELIKKWRDATASATIEKVNEDGSVIIKFK